MASPDLRVVDTILAQMYPIILVDVAEAWGYEVPIDPKSKRKQILPATEYSKMIAASLNSRSKVRSFIANLPPYLKLALSILKFQGGTMPTEQLLIMLKLAGMEVPLPPPEPGILRGTVGFGQFFCRTGIVVPSDHLGSRTMLDYTVLICDRRILAEAADLEMPTLPIQAIPAPKYSSVRRPAVVMLTVLGMLQAIEDMGGIKLTKSGTPQASSLKKLAKSQNWAEDAATIDGFTLPYPVTAWLNAMQHCGLLDLNLERMAFVPSQALPDLLNQPYQALIALLVVGFMRTTEWLELPINPWAEPQIYLHARQIIVLALQNIPIERDWYALDALSDLLYDRIADVFTITGILVPVSAYGLTPEQAEERMTQWRSRRRMDWEVGERRWLAHTLATWLYNLGLVELGTDPELLKTLTAMQKNPAHVIERGMTRLTAPQVNANDSVVALRLTELGQVILHPDRLDLGGQIRAARDATAKPAWIVQANFEIVMYLEEVLPQQMIFLEQYAQRLDVQSHTAHYRLTRDSVYQGLERSQGTLERFTHILKQGAKTPLPQNVEVELQQWGGLREQITLSRSVNLLEFPTPEDLQAAMAQGLVGKVVGDRFVVVTNQTAAKPWIKQWVNYDQKLPYCLDVNEVGEVIQIEPVADLLFEHQFQRWVEPLEKPKGKSKKTEPTAVAITQASVAQAIQAGYKASDLLTFLDDRMKKDIPPLLKVAIGAWAGRGAKMELADVVVLRIPQPEVFAALRSSQKFQAHFVGVLANDLFLVKASQLKALQQDLEWLGIKPATVITLE